MNLAIPFALMSLLFAGINDVVFKRYSGRERSRGMYIFGIGLTWTFLQAAIFLFRGLPLALEGTTVCYGLAASLFLVASNILLLESLAHINVSLGSTIYRLNTIGVVILSFLLLDEPFGKVKSIGIICGIVAVLFLYKKDDGESHPSNFLPAFCAVIVASLFRAAYGVVSKVGLLAGATPDGMLLIFSVGWILGGAAYALFREKSFRITAKISLYSLLSGVLVCLIVNFLLLAVEYGEATVVIPIANMSFMAALFIALILRMEALTFRKYSAVALAAISILLLSRV